MKKTSKIIVTLCVLLTIVLLSVSSYASVTPGSFTAASVSTSSIVKLGSNIVGVVRTVGVLVSVVILLVLGIKYMMGSAEEKADYKKSMIPYIVGAVLVFGATTIGSMVYDMASSIGQ